MLSRRDLCVLALAGLLSAGCQGEPITVYVVRHAEKSKVAAKVAGARASMAGDQELSPAGSKRALALRDVLANVKLAAVFSTPYRRTMQTVVPAAQAQGLTVQQVDADDVQGLVGKLKALRGGEAALVSGHSNTVPEIIEALGVSEKVELGEDDYGDLFVVTLGRSASLQRKRFGSAPGGPE